LNSRVAKPLILAILAIGVLALPWGVRSNYWLNLVNLAISFSIACLGLNIVLGYAGQLSLAQAAFWGVGAYTSAVLTTRLGIPVWGGMIAAFLVAAFVGVLVGIPTLKLSGHYLAMATIGLGIIVQLILINVTWLTNGADGISNLPSPAIGDFELDGPNTFFYVAAVSLILLTWASIRLKNSRVGRAFRAIQGNEMAAETCGVDSTRFKILAFALSAAYAGFGGSLFAHSGAHYISPDTFSFDQSVVLVAMTVLGGNGSAIGAVLGAILLTLLPEELRFLKGCYMMVYAAGIIMMMVFMPGGIAGTVRALPVSRRLRAWWNNGSAVALQPAACAEGCQMTANWFPPPAAFGTASGDASLLAVKGLTKHFGGVNAVDGVDLQVRRGEIHALIGPNGSGKTTILNMLSGLYVPTDGEIVLDGRPITGFKPNEIAAHGMARTFQNIRLFSELSVLENVLIGQHSRSRSGWLSGIFCPPSQKAEEAAIRRKALATLDFIGFRGKELDEAKSLPYGQQRLLELARALVSEPKLLLLDEPAAGLNPAETQELVDVLFRICDLGITILLVEHDMSLVMNVSDHITVLNFGRKIAEGSAEAVEKNQEVIDAYLGTEACNA